MAFIGFALYTAVMPTSYPIQFAGQLRQHLRALRKQRSLTQAQLGHLIGVSQARIAEIEAHPGLVSFEQVLKLMAALDVTLAMHEYGAASQAPERGVHADAAAAADADGVGANQAKRGEW